MAMGTMPSISSSFGRSLSPYVKKAGRFSAKNTKHPLEGKSMMTRVLECFGSFFLKIALKAVMISLYREGLKA